MRRSTVLAQVLKLLPKREFFCQAAKHHLGRSLRAISRWDQLVGLLTSQITGQKSLRDIEQGSRVMKRLLAVAGCRPTNRSTLSRVNAAQPASRTTSGCSTRCSSAASASRATASSPSTARSSRWIPARSCWPCRSSPGRSTASRRAPSSGTSVSTTPAGCPRSCASPKATGTTTPSSRMSRCGPARSTSSIAAVTT